MPLCRLVFDLNRRSVNLNLNYIKVYQYVIFSRIYSTDELNNIKGWFCHPKKDVSSKSINLAFNSLMAETLQYERNIFTELLEELGLHKVLGNELKYFFSKDIGQFKHFGIELDRGELTENVVQHLGQFPFDMTPIYYYPKCKRLRISIKTILSIIEAQYLAYTLNIELKVIQTYFKEMRSCFFYYKSMRSLKRNLDGLLSDKNLKHMSISNIIFFLNNLRPFSLKQLRQVEKDLLGISWERTPFICPSLVKHSYKGIMFRINMLKDMGFTDEQIRLGLPYIGVLVSNLYQHLNYMLSEFSFYKNDVYFLRLLSTCYSRKRGINGIVWKSYEAIQKAVLLKEEKRQSLLKSERMICFLQERLGMTKNEWKIIRDHPAVLVEPRVFETLNFLEGKGFTKEEILESISIILYPKYLVEKNIRKVDEEADYLRKFGFEDGCVRKMTNYFSKGTKLKRKTLQLCLYYLERSVYVSDDIVLDLDKMNEEVANQPNEIRTGK